MQEQRKALVAAVTGSALWGLSGTAAQVVVQSYVFPIWGFVTIRMLGASLLLLVVARPAWPHPWKASFVLMGIFGLVGSQFSYLEALFYSNVTTATLLQFLFLPMVAGYELATGAIRWSARWAVLLAFAAAGTVLLVGTISSAGLSILITPLGLTFGLGSAVAGAYYTLANRNFVQTQSPWWVTTWGFFVGGIVTAPFGFYSLWRYHWPATATSGLLLAALVLFVLVAGTLLAFSLFVYGLRNLKATEAGVAGSFEPIVAAAAGFAFLGVALTALQYAGGALIVVAVALLGASVHGRSEPEKRSAPH
ncbi:MAG TPA: DMT family transporter [Thermoplasmata archaeon]|nr:DMT family transporter [Thermoplasmata archaeon]